MEYHLQDFHKDQNDTTDYMVTPFNVVGYYENIRHSLNLMLKKPLKQPFATRGVKIASTVNAPK